MAAKVDSIPDWKRKLPMWATWGRVAIVPIIVGLFYWDSPWAGYVNALLFILASITDYLDGYWARKYQAESTMGKFMDPIADKILVAVVLIMLIPDGRVGPIMVLLLLCRDILVGGVRSIAASNNVIISAGTLGKWKTALQMGGIPAILIYTPLFGLPIYEIGLGVMWISVILSLVSGFQYIFGYFKAVKN